MAGADSGEGGGKERLPGFDKTKLEEQATTFNSYACGTTRWGIKTGTDGVTSAQMSYGPNGQALNETNGGGGWGYLGITDINAYTNPYGDCSGSGPWGIPLRGGFSSGGCMKLPGAPAPNDNPQANADYINGTSSCTSASQCVITGGDIMVTNGDVTCEADPARSSAKYCRYWAENTQYKIQNVTMVQYKTTSPSEDDQDIHVVFSTNANTRCWSSICYDNTVAGTVSCTTTGLNSPDCTYAESGATACVRQGDASPATYVCRAPVPAGNTFIGEIVDSTRCNYKCVNASTGALAPSYDSTTCTQALGTAVAGTSVFTNASNAARSFFQGAVTTSKPWTAASTSSWTYGAYTVSLRGVLFGDFGHGANGSSKLAFEIHPILAMCSGTDCMKDATNDGTKKTTAVATSTTGVPANGNFAASPWNTSWTTVSNTPAGAVASVARTPDNALKLCAGLQSCTGEVKTAAAVAIPSNASAPALNFVTYITTAETSGTYDYLYARVSSNAGSTWTNVLTYSNANSSTGYVARTVSLTAYKGLSVLVAFKATSDGSLATTFNVDDVTITGLEASSCTPTTCSALGKNCGSVSDGCGGTLSCGTCTSPQTCGGGGTANVCGCTPTTCSALGKNCGSVSDGCGGTLSCGTCASGSTCTSNVCSASTSCGTSSQLVLNTGIDSTTSWTVGTAGLVNTSSTYPARSATTKAWLCGYGTATNNATQYIQQNVTIPAAACTASVSFWVRVTTSEAAGAAVYDTMVAQVRNTSGTVLTTLKTLSNQNSSSTVNTGGSYVQYTFDLAAYKGQTVQLYFKGTEDGSAKTDFFLDDVTLNITQ